MATINSGGETPFAERGYQAGIKKLLFFNMMKAARGLDAPRFHPTSINQTVEKVLGEGC